MAEPTQGERIAVIETNVANILSLLQAHVDEPSCGNCKLTGDVAVCKTNIMWMKRVGYVVGSAAVGLFLAALGFDKIKF